MKTGKRTSTGSTSSLIPLFLGIFLIYSHVTTAQIAPISQSRFVTASVFGVTTNYNATDFGTFSANVSISSNDPVSGASGSGGASQSSSIGSSSMQAGGSASAGGSSLAAAGAASSFSVAFQVSSNVLYSLSGSLFRENGPGNQSGAPFVMLSSSMGTVFFVRNGLAFGGTVNFSPTGSLTPDTYTLTASANASGGSGGANESFNLGFALSLPPPFAFTAITPQTNDIVLTWTSFPGTTNIVQACPGSPVGGSYADNFSDISPIIIGAGSGTNSYLDAGGATNSPSRYYRVRIPGS
jgi:hypothetical protein